MPPRSTGKVKWFNPVKAYGFIERANAPDLFVHSSAIIEEVQTLQEGDRVEFDVMIDKKGPVAHNVVRLGGS